MSDRDYPAEAQLAAENHLAAISIHEEAADEALSEGKSYDELPDSPAVAPWDGCDTCVVREVLFAGWPYAVAEIAAWLEEQGQPNLALDVLTKFRIEGEPTPLPTKDELMKAREELFE